MLTLSRLAVRNEFCQEICDKGGLTFVIKCISEQHLKNLSLLKSALSLLKSICNNDQVKREATKSNVIDLLKSVLSKYIANPNVITEKCLKLLNLLIIKIIFFCLDMRTGLRCTLCTHAEKRRGLRATLSISSTCGSHSDA